ncbi:GFA family protein [Janthinobacterium sp. LB3P118]|uniref:GFA family protein n=1 Tax=Janthinobacterium sp. LB3P118 TaxID=3424195 RepID=UPI003F24BF20
MEKVVQTGGCLCGAVRFQVTGKGSNPHSCSCRNWQLGTANAPATYRSSGYSSRGFCAACGSSIGAIDDAPTVALLVGSFDDAAHAAFAPEYHSFEDARPGWWPVASVAAR